MKTPILLFLLFLACTTKAQNLLDENNLWMNVIESINTGVSYRFYHLDGDTVIASTAYKKLYSKSDEPTSEWEYIYGMREDSTGKVFFVLRNRTEERLLYDFNLAVGDSFFICNHVYIEVTSIDTVIMENGEQRKRIQFDPGPETWIEGIGSMDGIVADGGTWYCITTGEATFFLNCFTQNGEIVFKREFSPYLCLDGTTAVKDPETTALNLYPNPFSSSTTLELPDNVLPGVLNIFNLLGELVGQREIEEQYTTIYRSDLPGGIYAYQFVGREGQVKVGKVGVE